MSTQPYRPIFSQVHDVAIFGAGYAGFAAARALVAAGKSVALIDRGGDVLAESSRAFRSELGASNSPDWRAWLSNVEHHKSATESLADGAVSEILANDWVMDGRRADTLHALYYAAPMAVELGNGLEAVLMGTKSGMERLAARQWIDATETGELAALLTRAQGISWTAPAPIQRDLYLYLRHAEWPALPGDWTAQIEGAQLGWSPTVWHNERCLRLTAPGDTKWPRGLWVPALQAAREAFPEALAEAVLTHGSVAPFDTYAPAGTIGLPANVTLAAPWAGDSSSPAARFDTGRAAASRLLDSPAANPRAEDPFHGELHWIEQSTQVAVAGLGTGGAVAAMSAAREGGQVLGFDPLPFCGGIGSGGGIHVYYFGVRGGIQEEMDARIREVMPLFAPRGQGTGFHPDAKKCALESMILEAGASVLYGASILQTETEGETVTAALLATPQGPVRLRATAWIDSTGDGDLAASAGAQINFGRDGDGLLHAYSQSSGKANVHEGKAKMNVINYDAGFVDPTDSEDLTRARLEGIAHYFQEEYQEIARPTYIAPALGLRQGGHIEADYMLSWADQLARRRFPDSIGLTGCHYDNHAMDLEFESDEGFFWAGVCRGFRIHCGSEIPYRCLLPKGLSNVWVACRALGVTQDAHHSMRMQRDMQRIGEVAGIAAVLAPNGASREVDFPTLEQRLLASGALRPEDTKPDNFGWAMEADHLLDDPGEQIEAWLDEVRHGEPGTPWWHLYKGGQTNPKIREAVLNLLSDPEPRTSWRAAAIAAMWDEPAAEGPLVRQLRDRHNEELTEEEAKNPRIVHMWFLSISLLRRVGTPEVLPLLLEVVSEPVLPHNLRTSVALCVEAIAHRHELDETSRDLALQILETLIRTPAGNSVAPCQHGHLQMEYAPQLGGVIATRAAHEDFTWQIHLTVARARHVLGLPLHQEAIAYLTDDRALVRRAFHVLEVAGMVEAPRPIAIGA